MKSISNLSGSTIPLLVRESLMYNVDYHFRKFQGAFSPVPAVAGARAPSPLSQRPRVAMPAFACSAKKANRANRTNRDNTRHIKTQLKIELNRDETVQV